MLKANITLSSVAIPDDTSDVSDSGLGAQHASGNAAERITRLERRVERERAARREAERLLESKSLELFTANRALQELAESLERRVEERTAQIRDMEAQLRHSHKMEAVGLLAGGIAHDFNNLLMIIGGASALLPDVTSEDREQIMTELSSAVQRGRELTSRLLAFSRQEAVEQVELDVAATIASFEQLMRRLLTERIALTVNIPPGLGVRLTRGGLDQILFNLAANARDAMPHGGRMAVRAALQTLSADEAEPLQLEAGEYVLLEASDTGEGMTEETAQRAFDPFFSTKPVGVGSGLGLATVYSLVRQAKGHVSVQSAPGEGATFRILLPSASASAPAPEQAAPASDVPMPPGGRVLVVDDDRAVRRVIAALLRRQEFDVQEAESAEEALTVLRAVAPPVDLVVSDVRMPGMNGFELALELRTLHPTLPVLLVSGFVDDVAVHQRIEAEGLTLVNKPFDVPSFLSRVKHSLRADRARSHSSAA